MAEGFNEQEVKELAVKLNEKDENGTVLEEHGKEGEQFGSISGSSESQDSYAEKETRLQVWGPNVKDGKSNVEDEVVMVEIGENNCKMGEVSGSSNKVIKEGIPNDGNHSSVDMQEMMVMLMKIGSKIEESSREVSSKIEESNRESKEQNRVLKRELSSQMKEQQGRMEGHLSEMSGIISNISAKMDGQNEKLLCLKGQLEQHTLHIGESRKDVVEMMPVIEQVEIEKEAVVETVPINKVERVQVDVQEQVVERIVGEDESEMSSEEVVTGLFDVAYVWEKASPERQGKIEQECQEVARVLNLEGSSTTKYNGSNVGSLFDENKVEGGESDNLNERILASSGRSADEGVLNVCAKNNLNEGSVGRTKIEYDYKGINCVLGSIMSKMEACSSKPSNVGIPRHNLSKKRRRKCDKFKRRVGKHKDKLTRKLMYHKQCFKGNARFGKVSEGVGYVPSSAIMTNSSVTSVRVSSEKFGCVSITRKSRSTKRKPTKGKRQTRKLFHSLTKRQCLHKIRNQFNCKMSSRTKVKHNWNISRDKLSSWEKSMHQGSYYPTLQLVVRQELNQGFIRRKRSTPWYRNMVWPRVKNKTTQVHCSDVGPSARKKTNQSYSNVWHKAKYEMSNTTKLKREWGSTRSERGRMKPVRNKHCYRCHNQQTMC